MKKVEPPKLVKVTWSASGATTTILVIVPQAQLQTCALSIFLPDMEISDSAQVGHNWVMLYNNEGHDFLL
jgi:hypothetical protein